jgi:hypothetical protein
LPARTPGPAGAGAATAGTRTRPEAGST